LPFGKAAWAINLLLTAGLAAPRLEQPAALVLETGGSCRLVRHGIATEFSVHPGMVLFAGDALHQDTGHTELARCEDGVGQRVRAGAGSAIRFEPGLPVAAGNAIQLFPLGACRLPALARLPEPRNLAAFAPGEATSGSLQQRLAALPLTRRSAVRNQLEELMKSAAAGLPAILVSIGRALALESAGLLSDSAAEYESIGTQWPEADWTRDILERLRERELTRVMERTRVTARTGRVFAFVVGISRFRDERVPALRFADSDALLFARYLMSERGGALNELENLWFLTNEAATRDRVTGELTAFLRGKGSGENTLILYFATHGAYVCSTASQTPGKPCEREDAYILTHDSDPEDPKLTAIRMADIHDLITANASAFGTVLVYMDVCHSGNLGALPLETGLTSQQVSSELRAPGGNIGLMLASNRQQPKDRVREYALEDPLLGGGHGVFTFFVVHGLNGQVAPSAGNVVEMGSLMRHVEENVRAWTSGRQSPAHHGTRDDLPVVEHADKPGLDLPTVNRNMLQARAGRAALHGENDVRLAALQDRMPPPVSRIRGAQEGQQTILRYLRGDQVPQVREDFVDCARKFAEGAPGSPFTESRMLFCQGRALLFDRRHGEARQLLERAIRIDPGRAYAYNALGIAYLEQAEFRKAAASFADASRLAPFWAYPVHNLALAEEQAGNYDAAAAAYRRALSLAPAASYHAYNLGLLLQRMNLVAEARQMYLLAIRNGVEGRRLYPRSPSSWPNLAEGYNALGTLEAATRHSKAAKRCFEDALSLVPELSSAAHNLALLEARQLGDFSSAEKRWRRILQGPPAAHTPAARLALAEELARRGRLAEATQQYQLLLSDNPELASARRALSILLLRSGDVRGALGVLDAHPHPLLATTRRDLERVLRNQDPLDPELRRIARQHRIPRRNP